MKADALRQIQLAVIVAVVAVRMMQPAIDEVIDVVAMRDRFVPAAGAVDVTGLVPAAGRGVAIGIRSADLDDVFIDMIAMRMMQVPVVQIIDVPVVFHRSVAAAAAVSVVVIGVEFAVAHFRCGLKRSESPSGPDARQAGKFGGTACE